MNGAEIVMRAPQDHTSCGLVAELLGAATLKGRVGDIVATDSGAICAAIFINSGPNDYRGPPRRHPELAVSKAIMKKDEVMKSRRMGRFRAVIYGTKRL
jgi:hypothetical protein